MITKRKKQNLNYFNSVILCIHSEFVFIFQTFQTMETFESPYIWFQRNKCRLQFQEMYCEMEFLWFQTNIQIEKFLTIRLSVTKNHKHSIILKTDWLKVGCIVFKFSMGNTSFSAFSPGRLLPAPRPWYATEEIIIIIWGLHWWISTRVPSLVLEDPIRHGATKPAYHSYWACALGLESGHCNEQPGHRN